MPPKQNREKKSSSVCEAPISTTLTKGVRSLDNENFSRLLEEASRPVYLKKRTRRASTEEGGMADVFLEKLRQETETEEDKELEKERLLRKLYTPLPTRGDDIGFIDSEPENERRGLGYLGDSSSKYRRGNEVQEPRELADVEMGQIGIYDRESGFSLGTVVNEKDMDEEKAGQGRAYSAVPRTQYGLILGPQSTNGVFSSFSNPGEIRCVDKVPSRNALDFHHIGVGSSQANNYLVSLFALQGKTEMDAKLIARTRTRRFGGPTKNDKLILRSAAWEAGDESLNEIVKELGGIVGEDNRHKKDKKKDKRRTTESAVHHKTEEKRKEESVVDKEKERSPLTIPSIEKTREGEEKGKKKEEIAAIGAQHSTAGSVAAAVGGKGTAAATAAVVSSATIDIGRGEKGGNKNGKTKSNMDSGMGRARTAARASSDDGEEEFVSADEAPLWTNQHLGESSDMLLDGNNFRADDETLEGVELSKSEEEFITVAKGKKKVLTTEKRTLSTGGGGEGSGWKKGGKDTIRDDPSRRNSLGANVTRDKDDVNRRGSAAHQRHLGDFIDEKSAKVVQAAVSSASNKRGTKKPSSCSTPDGSPAHVAPSYSSAVTSPLSIDASITHSNDSTPLMSPIEQMVAASSDDMSSGQQPRAFSYADAAKKSSSVGSSRQGSPLNPPASSSAESSTANANGSPVSPHISNGPPSTTETAPSVSSTVTAKCCTREDERTEVATTAHSDISFFYDESVDAEQRAAETVSIGEGPPNELILKLGDRVVKLAGAGPQHGMVMNETHANMIEALEKHWHFFQQGQEPEVYVPKTVRVKPAL